MNTTRPSPSSALASFFSSLCLLATLLVSASCFSLVTAQSFAGDFVDVLAGVGGFEAPPGATPRLPAGWSMETKKTVGEASIISGKGYSDCNALNLPLKPLAEFAQKWTLPGGEQAHFSFHVNPNSAKIPLSPTATWPPDSAIHAGCLFAYPDLIRNDAILIGCVGIMDTASVTALRKLTSPPHSEKYSLFGFSTVNGTYKFSVNDPDVNLAYQPLPDQQYTKIVISGDLQTGSHIYVNGERRFSFPGVWVPPGPPTTRRYFFQLGQMNNFQETGGTPALSGSFLFDDVQFLVPRVPDLYVDSVAGNDARTGTTASLAFKTIQRAAAIATAGSTVHMLPGVYRETVAFVSAGTAGSPITYRAVEGAGSVEIRGTRVVPAAAWKVATAAQKTSLGLLSSSLPLVVADIASLGLKTTPLFVGLGASGKQKGTRPQALIYAREPDPQVTHDFWQTEHWLMAEGGSAAVADCVPATAEGQSPTWAECNAIRVASRSASLLTDSLDNQPLDNTTVYQTGTLKSLPSLVGARIRITSWENGGGIASSLVSSHDRTAGRITLSPTLPEAIVGPRSRYVVEGLPSLMDTEGEWFFDVPTQLLYVVANSADQTALQTGAKVVEVSDPVLGTGMHLGDTAHVVLQNLDFTFQEKAAITIEPSDIVPPRDIHLQGVTVFHSTNGISFSRYIGSGLASRLQQMDPLAMAPSGPSPGYFGMRGQNISLVSCEIAYTTSSALQIWSGFESTPVVADVVQAQPLFESLTVSNSSFHHISLLAGTDALSITNVNKLVFAHNHIFMTGGAGLVLGGCNSLVKGKIKDFKREELLNGDILLLNNLFEDIGVTISGKPAMLISGGTSQPVFRDLLVKDNVFRYALGYSDQAKHHDQYTHTGLTGIGIMLWWGSGVSFVENHFYGLNAALACYDACTNGRFHVWKNVFHGNVRHLLLGNSYATESLTPVDVTIVNNVFAASAVTALSLQKLAGANSMIDFNLYYRNGYQQTEYVAGDFKWGDQFFESIVGIHDRQQTAAAASNGNVLFCEEHAWELNPLGYPYPALELFSPMLNDAHHVISAAANRADRRGLESMEPQTGFRKLTVRKEKMHGYEQARTPMAIQELLSRPLAHWTQYAASIVPSLLSLPTLFPATPKAVTPPVVMKACPASIFPSPSPVSSLPAFSLVAADPNFCSTGVKTIGKTCGDGIITPPDLNSPTPTPLVKPPTPFPPTPTPPTPVTTPPTPSLPPTPTPTNSTTPTPPTPTPEAEGAAANGAQRQGTTTWTSLTSWFLLLTCFSLTLLVTTP